MQIHECYAQALGGEARGAVALNGDMIDAASLKMAERVVAKGRAADRL